MRADINNDQKGIERIDSGEVELHVKSAAKPESILARPVVQGVLIVRIVKTTFVTLLVFFLIALFLPNIHPPRPTARMASCANNLKQIGLSFQLYSEEHREFLPKLQRVDDIVKLSPNMSIGDPAESFFPAYFDDPGVLVCPNNRKHFETLKSMMTMDSGRGGLQRLLSVHSSDSYWYFGHRLEDEAALLAFVGAVKRHQQTGEVFIDENYSDGLVTTPFGRFEQVTWAARDEEPDRAPVMIERPRHHKALDGSKQLVANVLFRDGHVETLGYPGEFPMTKAVIIALESLDEE